MWEVNGVSFVTLDAAIEFAYGMNLDSNAICFLDKERPEQFGIRFSNDNQKTRDCNGIA